MRYYWLNREELFMLQKELCFKKKNCFSKQTLKFGDIVVNKKEFYASKQAIGLNLINTNKIVVSYRVKHSDDSFKYFIGYLHDDDVIRPLYIILPQIVDT